MLLFWVVPKWSLDFEFCGFLCLITSTLGCVFFTLYLVQPKQILKICCLLNFHCFKMAENVLRKLMTLLFCESALEIQDLFTTPPPSGALWGLLEELKCLFWQSKHLGVQRSWSGASPSLPYVNFFVLLSTLSHWLVNLPFWDLCFQVVVFVLKARWVNAILLQGMTWNISH